MPRLVHLATHAMTADLLMQGRLRSLAGRGHDVTLVCSPGPELASVRRREGVDVVPVNMPREIAPLRDLAALARLVRLFRRLRPDLVEAGTPKAGLLGLLAARLTGVPARVYVLRGLRLETARRLKRLLLGATECLTASCAHRILAVSPSLARRYVELGLAPKAKIRVPGDGSSNGVDVERFRTAEGADPGLPRDAPVVGFVGRFTRDKGLLELLQAFERLRADRPDLRLLLVGDFEEGDPVPAQTAEFLREHPAIVRPGFVADTAPYYPLMDVLAFPSHREGFPNAPLEAAAAGIPTVGFAVTGTVDAVADGETGTLVPAGNVGAFTRALDRYLDDTELARSHGEAARRRAAERFERARVRAAWEAELEAVLSRRTTVRPLYPAFLKRGLDLVGTVLALPVLAPVAVLVALLVRLFLGRPVLFRQTRPGRDGEPFTLLKFRTMTDARNEDGGLLPDTERLTRLGRFLRATSLDELPELVNVLRGEMSLVGPRPLLMEYLDRYTPEQARRHDVQPGITGWAQIHGRNALTWEEKFRHDVWYVDHRSFSLDLRILARTALQVLRREGIRAEGHATMPKFQGSPRDP